METEAEVLVNKMYSESEVLVNKMETESEVLMEKMETESGVLMEKMETESVVLVEHVLSSKDVSKGISDGGDGADDIACKDLVSVTVKERETVITEEVGLPATNDDEIIEIEKCTLMLQALPTTSGAGDGDGDDGGQAPAAEENSAPLDVSQAAELVTERNEEQGQAALAVAKKQEGCDGAGDGNGDGKAPAPMKNSTPLGASQATEMVVESCKEIGQDALIVKEQEVSNGDGDGKALAAEENSAPLGASQAPEIIVTQPCEEVGQAALVVAKEQEGRNGDSNGDGAGDGKALTKDDTSLPEFLPVPEINNEPLWGDVPDAIPSEPIVPPRPPKRPRVAPECVEVDDVVQTMRNILFNLTYEDDARLSPEDEATVRDLLEYHPHAEEKIGSGIDFIKIKRHSTYKDARCFWVVRTDGTETDFSYHKCLKMKVAKENPSFVDRYDAIYRAPKRPRMV